MNETGQFDWICWSVGFIQRGQKTLKATTGMYTERSKDTEGKRWDVDREVKRHISTLITFSKS